MKTEKHVERAVGLGQRNLSIVELIKNWCAHVRIEKHGWGGVVEQHTGLPIGPRSLTCPHAAARGWEGSDLKMVAIDFHDRNCVGCPHRQPVGLPNLSILVQERDAARAAASAESDRAEASRATALQTRDAKRQSIRAGLAPTSADVIDQIEELDHGRDGVEVDRLVETARLAPDVFTEPVVEYVFELLEDGESWFDRAGLRLLDVLDADKRRRRLVQCALLCIPRHFATEIAAGILVENVELADETLIDRAIPGLISLANPRRTFFSGDGARRRPALTAPLIRLHEAFPALVEQSIGELLDRGDLYAIGTAARGIAVLTRDDKSLPVRFARTLISKLVRDHRLLNVSELHDGDGETVNEVRHAVALAFEVAPAATNELLKAFLAGVSEAGEARIFSIYREVLRGPPDDDDADITEANKLALQEVVWHATRTSSYEVLREISDLVSSGPWGLAKLAAKEVRGLLGAAILLHGRVQELLSAPSLEDPTGMASFERARRFDMMGDLRDRLVAWAAVGAGRTPDGRSVYLEVLQGLPPEDPDAIRLEMVRHLHSLMKTTDGLSATLPHLYTAMVGASVALRASAADALGELDHRQQDNLPSLAFEAFMALLLDPYRMVHQHAAHALRRLWPPDEYVQRAKPALLALIITYAQDRHNDRFLVEILDFYIDHYAKPDEFTGRLGAWLLSVLHKIQPWVVAREITTFGRAFRTHKGYGRLLVRLVGDSDAWHISHENLTRALADMPADVVRRELPSLEALAGQARDRDIDGFLVEVFSRAGAWSAAERIARAKLEIIPDDAWDRPHKLAVDQMRVATEFEAALATGSIDQVERLSAEWKIIETAIEKDLIENEERRDPLRGLLHQNKSR